MKLQIAGLTTPQLVFSIEHDKKNPLNYDARLNRTDPVLIKRHPRNYVKKANIDYTTNRLVVEKELLLFNKYIGVSTVYNVPYTHFLKKFNNAILAVDCDTEPDFRMAEIYIRHVLGFGTYCIQSSSKGHYWIIADYVDNITNILSIMFRIPGKDVLHYTYSFYRGHIILRAVPRYHGSPIFPENMNLIKNPKVRSWINLFKGHYESTLIKRYVKGVTLQRSQWSNSETPSKIDTIIALGDSV